jgi:hypothetical protein
VAGPLLYIQIKLGMPEQKAAQQVRQMLRQRSSIAQQADSASQSRCMIAKLTVHEPQLVEDGLSMMGKCSARWRWGNASPVTLKQGSTKCLFHSLYTSACRGKG